MMDRRVLLYLAALWIVVPAAAQRPISDVEDFVEPEQDAGPLFVSRLIAGRIWNFTDGYRPSGQDALFFQVANNFYFSHFQVSYKHSEVRGDADWSDRRAPIRLQSCRCDPPIYFPAPDPDAPAPPPPGPRDTLQFAWYRVAGPAHPATLRYSLYWTRQAIETRITSVTNAGPSLRLHGEEQTFALDADTRVRIGRRRAHYGVLSAARTLRSGTVDDRAQTALTYTALFPAVPVRKAILRATVTAGGVTGRGASGLNLLNPAFEAFWHDDKTDVNFHLIYSPQATRSGAAGWQTDHQLALFIDRALYVKLFARDQPPGMPLDH